MSILSKPAHDNNTESSNYRQRAAEHAPETAAAIREAAQGLIDEGHSEHGAAAILGLDVGTLRRLVGRCAECEE